MLDLSVSEARIPPKVFSSVVYKGEWARISKRGGEAVYLVSEDDIRLLEEIEDRRLAKLGEEALEKHRRAGEETVSWDELKDEAVTR
jgi:PHD/YefM family antitoxin component YafN of YafNO toxin-antitoxin module